MDDSYFKGYREGYLAGLDVKENHKVSLLGLEFGDLLDIVKEHVKKKQRSEIPDIPMGFTFNWHNRKQINDVFCELSKQGFVINKIGE